MQAITFPKSFLTHARKHATVSRVKFAMSQNDDSMKHTIFPSIGSHDIYLRIQSYQHEDGAQC